MLISQDYRELNRRLHSERPDYGVSGERWAAHIRRLADHAHTRDILDYGCGKRTLEKALGFQIRNYDPCISGVDAVPEPAELVVCGDVLEHIEPENLDDVLDDLKRVTSKWGFFVINTGPAKKFLADGRNAHLIQEKWEWWEPKITSRFGVVAHESHLKDVVIIVASLSSGMAPVSRTLDAEGKSTNAS